MLRRLAKRLLAGREQLEFDLVIVGAGPCGLSAAIRAKQVNPEISVCVVDKGATVGAHIISGNIFDPKSYYELFPGKQLPSFVTPVRDEQFSILTATQTISIPQAFLPNELDNQDNVIMSLGEFCTFMAAEAESLGAEIFPGFAVAGLVESEVGHKNRVVGVYTRDVGVGKDGKRKSTYSEGVELLGKQVIVAEGAKGSLATEVIRKFKLVKDKAPQKYSLGLKEVFERTEKHSKFRAGSVIHTVGWPLKSSEYGGGFIYFKSDMEVHLGLVVGLDYKDARLNPYEEFQKWKTHDFVKDVIGKGNCTGYGARVINSGGYQSLPELTFPGGLLAGCAAGFLNVPRIKGTHLAMKTGMLAAEAAVATIAKGAPYLQSDYAQRVADSWVMDEMRKVRNCKPAFKYAGLFGGLLYSGMSLMIFRGNEPWTFTWKKKDWEETEKNEIFRSSPPRSSIKADGQLTFRLLDNLARTNVNHVENQESHLRIAEPKLSAKSLEIYDGPEQRFCPAGVYEYPDGKNLVVNSQNCIHCKTCAVKTPFEFVDWTVPEGGDGPNYSRM